MEIKAVLNAQKITELAKERFKEERSLNHLEGWFLAKEIQRECDEKFKDDPDCIRIAKTQVEVMRRIPLSIGDYVNAGETVGILAEPSRYYSVEGPNLYFEVMKDGEPVDPMNFME